VKAHPLVGVFDSSNSANDVGKRLDSSPRERLIKDHRKSHKMSLSLTFAALMRPRRLIEAAGRRLTQRRRDAKERRMSKHREQPFRASCSLWFNPGARAQWLILYRLSRQRCEAFCSAKTGVFLGSRSRETSGGSPDTTEFSRIQLRKSFTALPSRAKNSRHQ
jgi:hypothetical protein